MQEKAPGRSCHALPRCLKISLYDDNIKADATPPTLAKRCVFDGHGSDIVPKETIILENALAHLQSLTVQLATKGDFCHAVRIWGKPHHQGSENNEIGRASCRERV